jgi:hypothetical protein
MAAAAAMLLLLLLLLLLLAESKAHHALQQVGMGLAPALHTGRARDRMRRIDQHAHAHQPQLR